MLFYAYLHKTQQNLNCFDQKFDFRIVFSILDHIGVVSVTALYWNAADQVFKETCYSFLVYIWIKIFKIMFQ